MIALVALAVLSAAGIVGSIVAVARDGYRPVVTQSSRDRIRAA